MKLIIGLGNPENKYNFTRHNTGFLVLDYYLKKKGIEWKPKPHLNAIWAKDGDIIYIKPQGYYNNSGVTVDKYMDYYKIRLSDILVICDDFNLQFGDVRFRHGGRHAGNNGLKSIVNEVRTNEFSRIRVGTGNPELRSKLGDVDFVLSKFTPEEKEQLPALLDKTIERMEEVLRQK